MAAIDPTPIELSIRANLNVGPAAAGLRAAAAEYRAAADALDAAADRLDDRQRTYDQAVMAVEYAGRTYGPDIF